MSGDSAHGRAAKGVPNIVVISEALAVAQIITAISKLLNDADNR